MKRGRKAQRTDFLPLLASKLFANLSWKKWRLVRVADNLPIYRNELQQTAASLSIPYALPTYTCVGGYLPPVEVLMDLLTEYGSKSALSIHPSKPVDRLWVKLAIDNTRVFYTKTEGYYLSLLDVEKCQSTKHIMPIAITKTVDENSEMQRVVVNTNMLDLVTAVTNTRVALDGVLLFVSFSGARLDWRGP